MRVVSKKTHKMPWQETLQTKRVLDFTVFYMKAILLSECIRTRVQIMLYVILSICI